MMRSLFFILISFTFSFAGFFNNDSNDTQKENMENERLCQLFTEKAETYKATMRKDALAVKTLQSYEKRAALYCSRVQK